MALSNDKNLNILIVSKTPDFHTSIVRSLNRNAFTSEDTIIVDLKGALDFALIEKYAAPETTIHIASDFSLIHNMVGHSFSAIRHERHIDFNAIFLEAAADTTDVLQSNIRLGVMALKTGNQPLQPPVYYIGPHAPHMKDLTVNYAREHIDLVYMEWIGSRLRTLDKSLVGEEIVRITDPSHRDLRPVRSVPVPEGLAFAPVISS